MIVDDLTLTPKALADAERWTAHNYHPLPVVVAEAEAPGSPTSTAAATWTASPDTPR